MDLKSTEADGVGVSPRSHAVALPWTGLVLGFIPRMSWIFGDREWAGSVDIANWSYDCMAVRALGIDWLWCAVDPNYLGSTALLSSPSKKAEGTIEV